MSTKHDVCQRALLFKSWAAVKGLSTAVLAQQWTNNYFQIIVYIQNILTLMENLPATHHHWQTMETIFTFSLYTEFFFWLDIRQVAFQA